MGAAVSPKSSSSFAPLLLRTSASRLAAALALASPWLATACTTRTVVQNAAPAAAEGDSADATGAPIDKAKLGADCALACEPGVVCAASSDECALGTCVLDSRAGRVPEAYCSAACDDDCPEGYACEEAAHSSERVCVAKAGRCGDGALQGKEACDDGNAADFDACSKDCSLGAPTFATAARFGRRRSQGLVVSLMPIGGEPNGCNRAAVTELDGRLSFDVTLCDASTDERLRMQLRIPNAVGVATLLVQDIDLTLTSVREPSDQPEKLATSCPGGDCGITVEVTHAWGSADGFIAKIDGTLLSATSTTQRLEAALRVLPPGSPGAMELASATTK